MPSPLSGSPEAIPLASLARSVSAETSSATRRPSETPSIFARRGSALPTLPMPPTTRSELRRPQPRPVQKKAVTSPVLSERSQRSVHFSSDPFQVSQALSSPTPHETSHSGAELLPRVRRSMRPPATLFGRQTKFRPLYLLGMANTGACVFGLGEVVLQRAIWPVKAYGGLQPDGPTYIPAGTPGIGTAFGGRMGGIAGGTVLMAVGVSLSLTASGLFLADGRRLNRRQNPANPNYRRTMGYFYAHQCGLALLIGHRFAIETFRLYLDARWQWVAAMPAAIGQAVFAVTQAQSFSSSEVYNGKMPLPNRGAISAVARAGVSTYVLLAAIAGTPNFPAYWREAARLVAQTCTAVAYSLPLTTARLNAAAPGTPRLEVGEMRFRGDWTALQIFGIYAQARLLSMLGAYWLSHTRWPPPDRELKDMPPPQGPLPTGWRGLPPPLPNGPADFDGVSCAIFTLASATLLGAYAFYQFRKDAAPPRWHANAMFGLATMCLIMGQIYRVMTEDAKSHANFERVWEAMPVGLVANALAFVLVPEMFSRSEVSRGNSEIPYRYQVTEACRAAGNLSWTLWAAMSGILGFPPLARMMMNWSGSVFTILGMSLPDADTRRIQTGSIGTPQGEPRSWLEAHTTSR